MFSGVSGIVFAVRDSGCRLESKASVGQVPEQCRQDFVHTSTSQYVQCMYCS